MQEDNDMVEMRKKLTAAINSKGASREELEKLHGKVWDTEEMLKEFDVAGFLAPFCCVTRKEDGKEGSLLFQHDPRFYFLFAAADGT